MGLLQSIFCTISFCLERVLTWTICALLLMLLMFAVVILMVYGIAAGYHYAQKELSVFAMSSRTTTSKPNLRDGYENQPVVRLLAVNQTETDRLPLLPRPHVEVFEASNPSEQMLMDSQTQTPIVVLETDRPSVTQDDKLTDQEREIALRLIGRMRRSRNSTAPFFRMLNTTEPAIPIMSTSLYLI